MVSLPNRIEVHLQAEPALQSGILVALRVFHEGRPYYTGVLRLSDADGRVVFTRESIEAGLAENAKLFPMDYRVPIEACDPEVSILVPGSSDFSAAKARALSSIVTAETAKDKWRAARNALVTPAEALVRCPPDRHTAVQVDIVLSRAA